MDAETRKVLSAAKGLISRGWCQSQNESGGGFCAHGALFSASGLYEGRPWDEIAPLIKDAERYLDFYTNEPYSYITWNDAPGRTQDEVVALFDRALTENPVPAETPELVTA